jgi:hypothetical protein
MEFRLLHKKFMMSDDSDSIAAGPPIIWRYLVKMNPVLGFHGSTAIDLAVIVDFDDSWKVTRFEEDLVFPPPDGSL